MGATPLTPARLWSPILSPNPAIRAISTGLSTRAVNGVVRLVMISAMKMVTISRPQMVSMATPR